MNRLALAALLSIASCGAPDEVLDEEASAAESVELIDESAAAADETAAGKADAVGLTTTQARNVLNLLDQTCGDTWCEGDYNWQFKKLVCNFGARRCTLTMLIDDRDGVLVWRSVRLTSLSGYASLVTRGELKQTFYDKVNRAITLIEGSLR